MPPEQITAAVLRQVASALRDSPSFSFTLSRVGRFPATAYLAPEPAEAFLSLTKALVRQFPAYPPFRGEHPRIVPHLTVANGSVAEAALAATELEALLRASGPIQSTCCAVTLLENSSGFWKEMHVFDLSKQDD